MILNRGILSQFPFHGTFFTVITTTPDDGDLLGGGSSETVEETVLLETECDIEEEEENMFSDGTIMADYEVSFPCDVGAELPIRFNTNFRCLDYAIPVQGRVVGLEYSQLGGCTVDIKMSEV